MELFVESAVTVTSQLTNVTTVGVVIDNKLTYHDPSNVKATFVQTGRITAVVEMEGKFFSMVFMFIDPIYII